MFKYIRNISHEDAVNILGYSKSIVFGVCKILFGLVLLIPMGILITATLCLFASMWDIIKPGLIETGTTVLGVGIIVLSVFCGMWGIDLIFNRKKD